jgi:ankyrin repeat protein
MTERGGALFGVKSRFGMAVLATVAFSSAALAAGDDLKLVTAMKNRDLATVRALVAEGVGVNAQDNETATALLWAAHWSDAEAVELLLDAGADPNIANRFGVTPLHEAAIVRNEDIVAALLAAGADANAAFGKGESVLMTAARTGDLEAVRMLLDHGAAPETSEGWHGQTALMWAALEGHEDVVRLLIAHGADVNRRSTAHDWIEISYSAGNVPKSRDIGGLTPLHFAARNGSLAAADVLLDSGADPDAVEPMYELTAMQLAVVNGHYRLAAHLLDRGINADDGSLYLAIDTRNLGFYAQRPNPPENDGDVGNIDIIERLLDAGADPNAVYEKGIPERTVAGEINVPEGATPLDRATVANDLPVIRALIEHGADPSIAAADGTTPLMHLTGYTRRKFGGPPDVAGDPARIEAVRLLLEAGADVDAVQDETGNTAAHYAAMRGAQDLVALLQEFGASFDIENADGKTPSNLLADL